MIIYGIDPGATGGIAAAFGDKILAYPMPELRQFFMDIASAKGGVRDENMHVFIEKCQALPGNGSVSMFNYGRHFGELLGVLVACGVSHTLVPPKTWTSVMHLGTKPGKSKDRSLEACSRLFPGINLLATEKCKKPHEGIVDALLIMEYGRRILGGARQ